MTLSDDYAGADANDEDKRPKSLRRRAASRLAAVQTLFQCWASQKDPTAIVPQFKDHFLPELLKEFDIASIDDGHYTNLVFGAYQEAEQIDAEIAPCFVTIGRLNAWVKWSAR